MNLTTMLIFLKIICFLFHLPHAASFLPSQNYYPHIRPSAQFGIAPHAPHLSYSTNNNFQNSNFAQSGIPMSNLFRQDTGVVHGLVHPDLNYDGSQLHAESIQFGGHNSLSHPAVSSTSAKQEKEPDADEQQQVTVGKINHGTSGELGCSVPLVARQDGPDASSSYPRMNLDSAGDIEAFAQDAVLRDQEIATQKVIQRHAKGASGLPEDGRDIFSGRHDPNALKEHLLKMTTEHRAEIALKRGKSTGPEEGNLEIGNGYGVPGGGAYYSGPRTRNIISSKSGVGGHEIDPEVPMVDGELGKQAAVKELPEYLKQKLKAGGILRDVAAKEGPAMTDNKFQLKPYHLGSCLLDGLKQRTLQVMFHTIVMKVLGKVNGTDLLTQLLLQSLLHLCHLQKTGRRYWMKKQGPLFQQRPYPSPGAVLRKKAEIVSQKKKPKSHFAPILKGGDGSDGLGDAD